MNERFAIDFRTLRIEFTAHHMMPINRVHHNTLPTSNYGARFISIMILAHLNYDRPFPVVVFWRGQSQGDVFTVIRSNVQFQ